MSFAVGYQLPDEDERPLTEVVGRLAELRGDRCMGVRI